MPDETEAAPRPSAARFFRGLGRLLRWIIYLLGTLWAFGAIYFDGPAGPDANLVIAISWAVVTLTYFTFLRGVAKRFFAWLACMLVVVIPWLDIQPAHDREWHPDYAQLGSATIKGDTVTLVNFRNFDYADDGTPTERWEERTVRLSKLQGLDYIQSNFYGQVLAHPILSFDFGEDGRIALSIETRREKEESFAVLPGLYKTFELQHLFGDERDLVRVRSNVRKEPVHVFRTKSTPAHTKKIFLAAIEEVNSIHETPRFYNVVTHNCTTGLRALTPPDRRVPWWDYRILFNGRLNELLYKRDLLVTGGLSSQSLTERALITEAAQAAHADPDFSNIIRQDLPTAETPAEKEPQEPSPAEESTPAEEPAPTGEPAPAG